MANQMIALQARAPQSAGLGSAIQQNAQMINMMMQQRAAERQNALAAQKLQLDLETAQRAQGKEARDIKAADIELAKNQLDYHSKRATAVRTPQGYSAWLTGVEQDSPEIAEFFKTNLPPEEFDRKELIKMIGGIKENFDATFAPVKEDVTYDLQGYKYRSRTGGFEGQGDYPLDEMELDPTGGAPRGSVELGEQTTVEGGQGGPMLPTPDAPSMPGVNPSRVSTDMAIQLTNARNDAEYQQALGLIQRMNPQAAQALRQIMPTFQPELMATIRDEAKAAFGGQAAQPPTNEFPLVAGPRGGPLEGYRPSGRQARGKPLLQSPAPGTNIQTLPRIENEARATEGGKQGVRVETEPVIAGKSKEAELAAQRYSQLKTDIPRAHSQVSSLVGHLTDRINRIDKFLRNPYRNTVIGSIEGRIPEALMNERRADAIADWNFIKNNSVIDKLLQDRQSTETGASPQGMVSDRDLGVAATAANSLTRTGSERSQEEELKRLRDVLYRTREAAMRTYSNTYSELVQADPRFRLKPRPVSPKYTGPLDAKRTRSGATVENWD